MTRADFIRKAGSLGIRPDAYDFIGVKNESYAIASNGAGYDVFYSERGRKTGIESFSTEAAALEHLLELLNHDPTTRAS